MEKFEDRCLNFIRGLIDIFMEYWWVLIVFSWIFNGANESTSTKVESAPVQKEQVIQNGDGPKPSL
jgi:hypothetical protein